MPYAVEKTLAVGKIRDQKGKSEFEDKERRGGVTCRWAWEYKEECVAGHVSN